MNIITVNMITGFEDERQQITTRGRHSDSLVSHTQSWQRLRSPWGSKVVRKQTRWAPV